MFVYMWMYDILKFEIIPFYREKHTDIDSSGFLLWKRPIYRQNLTSLQEIIRIYGIKGKSKH